MFHSLGFEEKGVALRACATVVSVASFSGERLFFACSGTIIECEEVADVSYVSTILTTASLFRCSICYIPSLIDSDTILDDMKVEVNLADGSLFEGNIIAYDFHFNIALIKIKCHAMQNSLKVRYIEDSESLDPLESVSTPYSELFQIRHGDMLVILGRHFVAPYDFDGYSGTFSPVVSRHGEFIGVAFGASKCTPFLPINIASMCIEYFKRYGKFSRPYVGMDFYNFNAAMVIFLKKFLQKFRNTFKGVFVEGV